MYVCKYITLTLTRYKIQEALFYVGLHDNDNISASELFSDKQCLVFQIHISNIKVRKQLWHSREFILLYTRVIKINNNK